MFLPSCKDEIIAELTRDHHHQEEGQSLKAKTRERVQPKMGKIDIDYQKLHDAFFKFQTKPKMTEFGELSVLVHVSQSLVPPQLTHTPPGTMKGRSLRRSSRRRSPET